MSEYLDKPKTWQQEAEQDVRRARNVPTGGSSGIQLRGQGEVKERSRRGQGEVKERSRRGHGEVKERSRKGQGEVKERSRRGQGEVKER